MPAPYSPNAVANAFLNRANTSGDRISHMKLQKLVYFAHGHFVALRDGEPLLDELFEAWPYGPVLPTLYHEFKDFGAKPIDRLACERNEWGARSLPTPPADDHPYTTGLLNWIYDNYGKKSAIGLSDITHKVGSPWYKIRFPEAGTYFHNQDIPNDSIRDYFTQFIKKK